MKTKSNLTQAFVSAKLTIVLPVILGGGGLLAYEWRQSHHAKVHETTAHHKKHHDSKTASANQ